MARAPFQSRACDSSQSTIQKSFNSLLSPFPTLAQRPMPSPFIADGYTRCASVAGCDLFPPVRFEYRPMLAVDRAQLLERIRRLAPDGDDGIGAVEQIIIQELSRRLVSWTLVDDEQAPLPIADETLIRVESNLLANLASIVLGLSKDDAAREALDEKNCGMGCGCFSPLPALLHATVAIANCTSTTKQPVAGNCMRANRSCGQPAHILRAGCRTWVAPKEPPKIRTRSVSRTRRRTGSIARAAQLDSFPKTPSSVDMRS